MTARKRVGTLPARRLAWRRVSPCSSNHHSSLGSSSDASPAHASGDATPDQSLSGYSSPATTIDDSPASPRFVYPPIMTLRYSEAYRRWRSTALSTMYPLTTSELSPRDSSSESYAGSSRKRCKSPAATMPLPTSALGAIEEDIDVGVGVEVNTGIGIGVEVAIEERIRDIEAGQRQLEIDSLRLHMLLTQEELRQAYRARYYDRLRTMTNTRSGMTSAAIEEMIKRHVAEALEAREANRNLGLGNDNDEGGNGNGDGNGNGRGNGNGNHNENDKGARPIVQECTY
ncbi:hypothetical protein Tco_1168490 [Tanacetum coccineum]